MHFHQNVFCKMEFLQLLFVITWTHVYTYKYQRIDTQIPIMYNSNSLFSTVSIHMYQLFFIALFPF